jgi:hypothetical protein
VTCSARRPGGQLRKVDVRAAFDLTRLFTASIADLVEDRFESDAMRGVLSVSGVIGTWAGPRSAGTAYVMLHHHIGETTWGFPRGGMGAVTALAGARGRSGRRSAPRRVHGSTSRRARARRDPGDGTRSGARRRSPPPSEVSFLGW